MELTPAEALVADPSAARAAEAAQQRPPHLTIKPARGWIPVDFAELWQFRDLLFALASRDLKLRYKQTALGVTWVILGPLLSAGILSFVFGTVAHLSFGKVPVVVFVYAGQLAWNLFNNALSKAGGSLVGNANLISKVFFPRLILPLSTLLSSLVDFAIGMAPMAVLLVIYHIIPGWGLLLLPIWTVMLLAIATGAGLVFTSLMVTYRDVQYIMTLGLQILMYATPVIYPASKMPEKYQFWFQLNPLYAIFEAIHWSLVNEGTIDIPRLIYSAIASVVILFAGIYAFKRMEQKFADII